MFETETEATNKITQIEAKGEKRSTLEEDPCLATKKHKLSSNEYSGSQFGNTSLFDGSGEVVVNNANNNETQTSGKSNSVREVSNINLNASKTEIHVIRSDTCKQASFRMQVDDTCPAISSRYTDSRTPGTCESTVSTHSNGRYRLRGENAFKGSCPEIHTN